MENDKIVNFEQISLSEFREYMFYPVFPLDDIFDLEGRIMSNSFPFWRVNGLLPFIPKGKWNVNISFSQVIWLRILDQLRAFGYSVKDTVKLCDRLFKDAYEQELPKKKLKYHFDRLKKIELAGTIDAEDKELLRRITQMLEDSMFLYGLKFEFNFLTELIIWCIENNEDAGLMIFPDGVVLIRKGDCIVSIGEIEANPSAPHINISILYFLIEFIKEDELKLIHVPGMLTENEIKVLKALKGKNVHELQIKFLNGEVDRIDSKTIETFGGEKAKRLRLAIGLGQYEEITLSTRDAQSITFKKVKKIIQPGRPGI